MIDIHAHVLPFVDDGSKSLERSIEIVKNSILQGVSDMVLTPHFDQDYKSSKEELETAFNTFVEHVNALGLNVNLYLGQEIFVSSDVKKLVSSGNILTLNDTEYILIEFSVGEDFDIAEAVYEFRKAGYKPIVAHFERYPYADISVAEEIKSLGGLIQVNSDSLVGKGRYRHLRKVKSLFKEGFVDFVASDIHEFRKNSLKKAQEYVAKKYGKKVADAVFINNAKEIIKG